MATAVVCPSCKGQVGVSGSFSGGLIACPSCNHQFVVTAPRCLGAAAAAAARGGRPELLDQVERLPRTLVVSPVFRLGAAGGVVLYGVGLAVLMSSLKANPSKPNVRPPVVVRPQPAAPPAQVVTTPVAPAPVEPPKPAEPPAPAPPAPVQVAKVDAAPKVDVPAPAKPPAPMPPADAGPQRLELGFDALAGLLDPAGDCQLAKDAQGITINVPGNPIKAHLNELKNAPKALLEVTGDFDARLQLTGALKPGFEPVRRMPICFQGAGLLLMQDEISFLRLERSAASNDGRKLHYNVLLEASKDGTKAVDPVYVEVAEGPLFVRLERKGNEFTCSYGTDGQSWTELKKFKADYTPKVFLGISASSTSRKPFPARFENFAVSANAPAKP